MSELLRYQMDHSIQQLARSWNEIIEDNLHICLAKVCGEVPPPSSLRKYGRILTVQEGEGNSYTEFRYQTRTLFRIRMETTEFSVLIKVEPQI